MRSRKALQYAASIDDYVSLIKDGNNGGYANDWLIGDRKTGEIAYLELGLKNTPLWRTKDGYFVSTNFARDPQLIKEETGGFDSAISPAPPTPAVSPPKSRSSRPKARLTSSLPRSSSSTTLTATPAKSIPTSAPFAATSTAIPAASLSRWGPYYPGGAVTGKVADSDMAAKMSIIAHAGHPCGEDFLAAPFLAAHPEFTYLKPILKDMISGPWTNFAAGETRSSGPSIPRPP